MKQTSLKFKSYVNNVNIIDNSNLNTRVLHILLMSFGFFAILYVFVVGNTIFDIIARKSIEKESLVLSSEVGELELKYLSLSSRVDLELASSLGFKDTKPSFATRPTLVFNSPLLNTKLDNEI